jgi:GNAT superfamily N-acetyltransferase
VIAVRDAVAGDYGAYAALFGELGVDDPLPSRERFIDELLHRTIVAVDDRAVVGYALLEHMAGVGYIRNIVSSPACRRRGVGFALMSDLRERFARANAATWCLNVKPDNAAAIALYERFGLRAAYRSTSLRVPSSIELSPAAPGVALSPLPAAADPGIEPKLRLLPGQLASARSRPSREVLQLTVGADVVGACVFSPSFPGAFPFRLLEPALAATFIALLRPRVTSAAPYVQVVVEDDEALLSAALRLGATVQLEILHMTGTL